MTSYAISVGVDPNVLRVTKTDDDFGIFPDEVAAAQRLIGMVDDRMHELRKSAAHARRIIRAAKKKTPRLTPTQKKILENAAGKTPPHTPYGRSQHGGWSGAISTCYQRKWLRSGGILTDAGRKALEGGEA